MTPSAVCGNRPTRGSDGYLGTLHHCRRHVGRLLGYIKKENIALTDTPTPNDYSELYSQYLLVGRQRRY
jgi:hypothetical protein